MPDLLGFLGGPLVFFYSVAIIASLFLIIQLAMTALGIDGEMVDDLDAGDGTNVVSFRSLTGFFGGFGWTGVILLENDFSLTVATLGSSAVGLIFMFSFAYLMRILYSLRESGNIDLNSAIGQTGTVYVSIPPNETGKGQVSVMVNGRLKVIDASTRSPERIPSERRVRIQEMVGPTTYMVEPVDHTDEKEV